MHFADCVICTYRSLQESSWWFFSVKDNLNLLSSHKSPIICRLIHSFHEGFLEIRLAKLQIPLTLYWSSSTAPTVSSTLMPILPHKMIIKCLTIKIIKQSTSDMLHVSFLAPCDEQYVSIWVHWHTKLLFQYQGLGLWKH